MVLSIFGSITTSQGFDIFCSPTSHQAATAYDVANVMFRVKTFSSHVHPRTAIVEFTQHDRRRPKDSPCAAHSACPRENTQHAIHYRIQLWNLRHALSPYSIPLTPQLGQWPAHGSEDGKPFSGKPASQARGVQSQQKSQVRHGWSCASHIYAYPPQACTSRSHQSLSRILSLVIVACF